MTALLAAGVLPVAVNSVRLWERAKGETYDG